MTLCISVDVDGEAGLPDGGRGHEHRLTSRSERIFGVTRGLPRILEALADLGVTGTFCVPGVTALRHPDEIRAIVDAGHELAHHGHTHRRPDLLDDADQEREIAEGIAALHEVTGVTVTGYRAPGWELTPVTLAALRAHGFRWDSSLMGDDRPYRLGDLLEVPVHWSLDDAPHFARATDPAGLTAAWLAELRRAARERRHVTYTLHPEILGRAHRLDVLRAVLNEARRLDVVAIPAGALLG